MTARIVILTGSHLCHNPRVIKEAAALGNAGYEVTVLGAWFDPDLKERDDKIRISLPFQFVPVIDGTQNAIRWLGARVRGKLGSIAHRIVHIENRWQLGYTYTALRRAAFEQRGDFYIAHSEVAMAVAVDLLRSGRRVALDMEDWFSEDLSPEARLGRPLHMLRSIERTLLTRGHYATCPSRAMSTALAREFGCSPPTVVYNAFPWSDRSMIDGVQKDRRGRNVPSIHWFSQTLGPGRGLEDLLSALPLVDRATEIHLRGVLTPGFEPWLWQRIPATWRGRVSIHGLVSNKELLSRIAEHDIGFAGEMTYCRNRDLTVTNKILQYVLAGLAVVASDTAGQREVGEQAPDAVLLYRSGDSSALAHRLNALIGSPESLKRTKTAALGAAEQSFCWERQENVLLETIARALRASCM